MNEQSVYNEDWIAFNDKMLLILYIFCFVLVILFIIVFVIFRT